MFCPNCGSSVAEGQIFCQGCGKKILQKSPDEATGDTSVMPTHLEAQSAQSQMGAPQQSVAPIPTQVAAPQAPSININLSQNQNNSSALGDAISSAAAYVARPPEMKSKETAGILCLLLGCFGAHDLYVGKVGMGLIKIILTITCVGYFVSGIWQLIDAICILNGNYRDHWGRPLVGEAPVTKVLLFLPAFLFIALVVICVVLLISVGDGNYA